MHCRKKCRRIPTFQINFDPSHIKRLRMTLCPLDCWCTGLIRIVKNDRLIKMIENDNDHIVLKHIPKFRHEKYLVLSPKPSNFGSKWHQDLHPFERTSRCDITSQGGLYAWWQCVLLTMAGDAVGPMHLEQPSPAEGESKLDRLTTTGAADVLPTRSFLPPLPPPPPPPPPPVQRVLAADFPHVRGLNYWICGELGGARDWLEQKPG